MKSLEECGLKHHVKPKEANGNVPRVGLQKRTNPMQ